MSKKNTGTIWWAGFATHMALSSLGMDWRGQDGTIRLLATHWLDAKISVPLALGLLVYAGYRNNKAEKAIDATTFEMIEPSSHHSAHRAFTRKQNTKL